MSMSDFLRRIADWIDPAGEAAVGKVMTWKDADVMVVEVLRSEKKAIIRLHDGARAKVKLSALRDIKEKKDA